MEAHFCSQVLVESLTRRVEAVQVSTYFDYIIYYLCCAWDCLYRLSLFVYILQQIQSNFVVVIHPGSRTLRIGRATDTLPLTIPHVIARRHKQSGQPRYEDAWLLREGLNVCHLWPNTLTILSFIHHCTKINLLFVSFFICAHCFFLLSNRNQRVMNRGRMDLKWSTRPSGPRRCQTECGGHLFRLNRCLLWNRQNNVMTFHSNEKINRSKLAHTSLFAFKMFGLCDLSSFWLKS